MMLYPQATSEAGRKSVPIDSQPARTGRGGVPWTMYMLRNLRVLRGQLPRCPGPEFQGDASMLTAAENELLCRVEGDAPMGRLMRRHWVPALLSEQVARPNGAPVRVQLFGEKLVAFRDSSGKLGLLGEACPHRKASLAFGRNEECGLRCLYHGWKFDTDGNVLDMPSEPRASVLPEKATHLSYPTR